MIKKFTFILILCLTAGGFAVAEEEKKGIPLYSVSSEDFNTSDSLNRIAGDIDMGFNAPGQYNTLVNPSTMPRDNSDGY